MRALSKEGFQKALEWGLKKGPLYAEAMAVGYALSLGGPWKEEGKRLLEEVGIRPSKDKPYPEEALRRGMSIAYEEFLRPLRPTPEEGRFIVEAMGKKVPLWAALILLLLNRGHDLTGMEEWVERALRRAEEAGITPPRKERFFA